MHNTSNSSSFFFHFHSQTVNPSNSVTVFSEFRPFLSQTFKIYSRFLHNHNTWISYFHFIIITVKARNTLDNFSFSIGTGVDNSKLLEVCAHETLHFLWFEKWKQIHPETPRCEYDSPYLVWQYSEMVTDPILNNKPFSTMFEFNERGYDSFYELEDDSSKVMDKLRNIYSKDISIEEKMNDGFNYINRVLNKDKDERIAKK